MFHVLTVAFISFGQAEKAAYLVEREAEFPGPADEGKARDVGSAIDPASAFGAPRPLKNADLLIEADCVDAAAGSPRNRADRR